MRFLRYEDYAFKGAPPVTEEEKEASRLREREREELQRQREELERERFELVLKAQGIWVSQECSF